MAGVSDKARFYLEQSVPELRELERKKIFTKAEISLIAKKRSDFEHTLAARGSKPSDYIRYAQYEMNLDTLRVKRVKRLGIKGNRSAGQKRLFPLLDRATRKFPGDIGLWMQYIEYARSQKANNKLAAIFTSALRMHPTNAGLWILAAQYAIDIQADVTLARSYLQRGLRLCKGSMDIWLEYAKLEMIYISKILARRKILGLDEESQSPPAAIDDAIAEDDSMIKLPTIMADELDGNDSSKASTLPSQKLSTTPALSGAIPIAIFDSAMREFKSSAALAQRFFDTFAEFSESPCLLVILQHIVDFLQQQCHQSPQFVGCYSKLPLIGVDPASPGFPEALGSALERSTSTIESSKDVWEARVMVISWILPLLANTNLDSDLRKVLTARFKKLLREQRQTLETDLSVNDEQVLSLAEVLRDAGFQSDGRSLVSHAMAQWEGNRQLEALGRFLTES